MNGAQTTPTGGRTPSLVLAVGLLLLAAPLFAKVESSFSEAAEVAGERLELRGSSHFTYFRFSLYDAALYLPPDAPAETALEAAPKRLEIAYLREIPADKIVEAGDRTLEKNTTEEERASIDEQLSRINAAYRTVEDGDRYTLTYVPGEGTTLALNEETLATLEGEAFARLYFRIWLGEDPVNKGLRDALLGRE